MSDAELERLKADLAAALADPARRRRIIVLPPQDVLHHFSVTGDDLSNGDVRIACDVCGARWAENEDAPLPRLIADAQRHWTDKHAALDAD